MKLNANALALAVGAATAIIWIFCSLIVGLMPVMSMTINSHMMHSDFTNMQWSLDFSGLTIGLVVWSLIAGVTAWLVAMFYNKFI